MRRGGGGGGALSLICMHKSPRAAACNVTRFLSSSMVSAIHYASAGNLNKTVDAAGSGTHARPHTSEGSLVRFLNYFKILHPAGS